MYAHCRNHREIIISGLFGARILYASVREPNIRARSKGGRRLAPSAGAIAPKLGDRVKRVQNPTNVGWHSRVE